MNIQPIPRVIDIVPGTSVDGPGLRTSIYFAGCAHQCEGCHNPQSWPFHSGHDMSVDDIMKIVEENGFNVTFSGGDPIYQAEALLPLAKRLKSQGYNIWCYTGFLFEDLPGNPQASALLPYLDVIVDGPFRMPLRDISLQFRGSSNQRIINVAESLRTGTTVLWDNPHWGID